MVKLSDDIIRRIAQHGENSYPEECCGILLGRENEGIQAVRDVIAIDNSQDENRRRRFLITAEQYREAEKSASEKGMDLLGFYHSHPDHPPVPSTFDTEHALPWFTYIIVSVRSGKAGDTKAWLLNDDRKKFNERPLLKEDVR